MFFLSENQMRTKENEPFAKNQTKFPCRMSMLYDKCYRDMILELFNMNTEYRWRIVKSLMYMYTRDLIEMTNEN